MNSKATTERVWFNGREFRRTRFPVTREERARGWFGGREVGAVMVTFAVKEVVSASVARGKFMGRREV